MAERQGQGGLTAPAKIRELDFRRQIVGPTGLATIFGWEHVGWRAAQTAYGWRTPGTGTMAKGWPDLTLVRVRDRRLIFAELKAEDGRLRDEQYAVLEILRSLAYDRPPGDTVTGVPRIEVFVWRPGDLEQIAEVLR